MRTALLYVVSFFLVSCAVKGQVYDVPEPIYDVCALSLYGSYCYSVGANVTREYEKDTVEMVKQGYLCLSPMSYSTQKQHHKKLHLSINKK